MAKDLEVLNDEVINVKLSFNQIKFLIYKYNAYQTDSMEGKILQILGHHLREYLLKESQKGNLIPSVQRMVDKNLGIEKKDDS